MRRPKGPPTAITGTESRLSDWLAVEFCGQWFTVEKMEAFDAIKERNDSLPLGPSTRPRPPRPQIGPEFAREWVQ